MIRGNAHACDIAELIVIADSSNFGNTFILYFGCNYCMSLTTTIGSYYRYIPSKEYTEIATQAKETYRISLRQGQDGWLVVTSPDLKSLITQGKTEEDAIANAYEAAQLLLEESGIMKEFNLVVVE